MIMDKPKTILLILAIFFSGSAFGIFGAATYLRHQLGPFMDGPPPDPGPFAIRRLSARLGLNPAQEEQARLILKDFLGRMEGFHQEFKTKADPLLLAAGERLKAHLDPAQQAKLDRLLDDIIHHPPPPGPMGLGPPPESDPPHPPRF